MSELSLEVVTPRGRLLAVGGVKRVTVRRYEPGFARGGQVVFLPSHGAETVHFGDGAIEYVDAEGRVAHLQVEAGFAEVERDHVIVLTRSARPAYVVAS